MREQAEAVAGLPPRLVPVDARAEAILRERTLTTLYNTRGTPEGRWLDDLHAPLDAAVAAAYGWPEGIADDDALAALLAINGARAGLPSASARPMPTPAPEPA